MANILRLDANQTDFNTQLDALLSRETDTGADIQALVADILAQVKSRGDAALCEFTAKFDGWDCSAENMIISRDSMQDAWHRVSDEDRSALQLAVNRIRAYHEHQVQADWDYTDDVGMTLGQRITPLDKVGLYVPGGKAAYPSSVLMNAVPAHVAGVETIVMVVPTPLRKTR